MELFIIIIVLGALSPILGPILGLLFAAVSGLVGLIQSGYRYSNNIHEPEKKPRRAESWGFDDGDDDIGIFDDIFDDFGDDHDGSYYGDICDGTFENSYWD